MVFQFVNQFRDRGQVRIPTEHFHPACELDDGLGGEVRRRAFQRMRGPGCKHSILVCQPSFNFFDSLRTLLQQSGGQCGKHIVICSAQPCAGLIDIDHLVVWISYRLRSHRRHRLGPRGWLGGGRG